LIRLTEIKRQDSQLVVKIEGYLTDSTLQVVDQALTTYKDQQITAVYFDADGLVSVDRRALEAAQIRFPTGLAITFHTSRIALQQLLKSCGLDVAEYSLD
jgi:hypothetical protein